MSIEKHLEDLKAAVEANTAAMLKLAAAGIGASTGNAPATTTESAPKKTRTKSEDKPDPKVTQDQVNAALIKLKDDFDKVHAMKIIKEVGGVDKMADIKPATYQAVYDAAIKRHAELTEEANGGGGADDGL